VADDATERLRRERDLYLRLLELGTRDDLAPFLDEALASIMSLAQAQQGYLEVAASPDARFSIARGLSDVELEHARRQLSTGIIAEAIATGRTLSTASALDDPRFKDLHSVQAQKIRAVLCAPIQPAQSTVRGVLYLQGHAQPGPFSEDTRVLAETFARHLAPLADKLVMREVGADDGFDPTRVHRQRLRVESIVGRSRALAEVFRQVLVAAPVPVSVLITGESGTGKTAVARALHASSPRAAGPFVELNCAAIPETLFESELFGAEKGAHSTATRRIEGKVDAARSGTLFLDEVSEIPLALQSKLLQFLQSRTYYRLGSNAPLVADVRIVAATNADLEERVRLKTFREDLYYRLDVLSVRVPPLRERPDDIAPIADAIARSLGEAHGRIIPLARSARLALRESEWPGNVRQLENVLQRGWAVALSESAEAIEARHLFPARATNASSTIDEDDLSLGWQDATRRFQGNLLRQALSATGWNVTEAARRLGLARSRVNDLIRVYGLTRAGSGTRG
jgi:Nif-specific regulatory protein